MNQSFQSLGHASAHHLDGRDQATRTPGTYAGEALHLQATRARCIAPISDHHPAGEDPRSLPAFEKLDLEIDKLESPTRGSIDWTIVRALGEDILCHHAIDLRVGCFLGIAWSKEEGLSGLSEGFQLVHDLFANHWETMWPPARRIRGRANATKWFFERAEQALLEQDPAAVSRDVLSELRARVPPLQALMLEHLGEETPAISPVREAIERLLLSLPPLPESAQPSSSTQGNDAATPPEHRSPSPEHRSPSPEHRSPCPEHIGASANGAAEVAPTRAQDGEAKSGGTPGALHASLGAASGPGAQPIESASPSETQRPNLAIDPHAIEPHAIARPEAGLSPIGSPAHTAQNTPPDDMSASASTSATQAVSEKELATFAAGLPEASPGSAPPVSTQSTSDAYRATLQPYLRKSARPLLQAASSLRNLEPQGAYAMWLWMQALYLSLTDAPMLTHGAATMVRHPGERVCQPLHALLDAGEYRACLDQSTAVLERHCLTLDLHLLVSKSLIGLGQAFLPATNTHAHCVQGLLLRIPSLRARTFQEGQAIIAADTDQHFANLNGANLNGANLNGATSVGAQPTLGQALAARSPQDEQRATTYANAESLASSGHFEAALESLQSLEQSALGGHDRFQARLLTAGFCAAHGAVPLANFLFDSLLCEAETRDLSSWDPGLYRALLLSALQAQAKENPAASSGTRGRTNTPPPQQGPWTQEALLRRLVDLDPTTAWRQVRG